MKETIEFQGEDEDYLIDMIANYGEMALIKYIADSAMDKINWLKEREIE